MSRPLLTARKVAEAIERWNLLVAVLITVIVAILRAIEVGGEGERGARGRGGVGSA